jgi:hypothetical protein
MLKYLDNDENRKSSPNENLARELMELFTLGEGNGYGERDIKEGARALTGRTFRGNEYFFDRAQHDAGGKQILRRSGDFSGDDFVSIILEQPECSRFIAGKLYRYFVREDLSPALQQTLGKLLRDNRYDIAVFMETVLMSKDFHSDDSVATRIKPPVELVISTYKKMGLKAVPGIPDFNEQTELLGQKLFYPPNVAGWAHGRSWITPGLLLARGNVIYDTVFPPIDFMAADRVPNGLYQINPVADKLAQGQDITTATKPVGKDMGEMSMSNQGDRDEDFNTRLASYHAWRKAIEKVKPIERATAQLNVSAMLRAAKCQTTDDAVAHLAKRFLSVKLSVDVQQRIAHMLAQDLGTQQLSEADSYMEDALRNALHVILSLPVYQLG